MTASATSLETKQRPWGLTLFMGIMAVVIGAVLLWAPAKTKADTWMLLITILGFYWVIAGIMDIVHIFQDHSAWGWKLFIGLVSIAAGSYILMYPVASALVLPKIFVLVLGFWGLIQGTIMLLLAFRGGGWAAGILGVLGIIFGLVLIGNYTMPGMGLAFVWMAAISALIGGVLMIVQAFRQRRQSA